MQEVSHHKFQWLMKFSCFLQFIPKNGLDWVNKFQLQNIAYNFYESIDIKLKKIRRWNDLDKIAQANK